MRPIILLAGMIAFSLAAIGQTDREKAMIDEINLVRTSPDKYARFIDSYLEAYGASEGECEAAEELRRYLKKMKPLDPLEFSQKMYDDAVKHGKWMTETGQFEHSDLPYGENLVQGDKEVRFAMLNLLIDYGHPERGHRKNILNPNYSKVAVHETDGYTFIQEFR